MSTKNLVKKIWDEKYSLALLLVWTVLLCISAIWNLHENYRGTYGKALVEARTIFEHNLAYRRWNSMHGGVYAKVTGINQPNDYIVTEKRDITGLDGTKLTMINPFQMTKQAYDLLRQHSPELAVLNRTVSLDPLNVENIPDEWEEMALIGFEQGKGAMSEITTIEGAPYMRLLSPYITENRCLQCHEHQGYEVGDIRGGMSIAVPMKPYYEAAASSRKIIVMTHMVLWMLGTGTIILLFIGLKNYKNKIVKEEKKFRIVSEFAYNFEYWVNEKKELVFISPSCKRITGYSRQDFMKSTQLMFDLIHPDDKELFTHHLCDFQEKTHPDIEYRIVTKKGDIRWMSHTCSPIYVDGQFLGRRGSNRDITVNKQLEEELINAKKVECLGHFAGGVAHDFNNVLTSISTFTHLMMDEIDEDDKLLHEYINYIIIAAKLGQNMTSNLLFFGRKRPSNLHRLDLNDIINNIEIVLRSLLTEDIVCKISLTPEKHFVMVDNHQVEQIIINLATNARDAMPGGGNLSIETSLVSLKQKKNGKPGSIPAGDYMALSVSDTGSGIDDMTLATVFEPFYSTKSGSKGTGLGLAIVDNLVKQHDAYIDVESTLGAGTTFRILFPTFTDSEQQNDGKQEPHPELAADKKTILVVDDDWLIRKSIQLFLSKKGYNVLFAADGEEAVSQYQKYEKAIDLVVLDVMLPIKDGREVYDEIKQHNKAAKVLFVSGSTANALAEKNIMVDQMDFLGKPLDMKDLEDKIAEMVDSK